MKASHELFDHTADVGIRVQAASMPELIAPAVAGLYSVIGELVPSGDAEPMSWTLDDGDAADCYRDFLAELLILFERDGKMLTEPTVDAFNEDRLVVHGPVRPIDADRSELLREVKAITYHELAVRPVPGGYEAICIVDI